MLKRMTVLYASILCLAATLFFRIYYLTSGEALSTAAKTQSSYTLEVLHERGTIYDSRFQRLTNQGERYLAAVMPCPQALSALSEKLAGERRTQMIESFQNNRPFLIEVPNDKIYAYGVDVFTAYNRYSEDQLAAHIVGHLQDGVGAYGIEKAYDAILSSCGSQVEVSYTVDAHAAPLSNVPPVIREERSEEGVVLTLDLDIQRAAEEVASYYIHRGAVVVMDVSNGDIKASVSLPDFDPNHVADALQAEGNPFINRVNSAYNVGSTFKLLTAACALDHGVSENLGYECVGAIEIAGVRFRCHKIAGHSWLTMQRALEQSCNPYFINLGQKLDPADLLELCGAVGLARQTKLAPQLLSAAGTLPDAEELASRAALANFSFGQGSLTATPLQIAQVISCIANGGNAVTPRLVAGATTDGLTLSDENPNVSPVQVISPQTAAVLRRMMVSTVEQGSGTAAKPDFGSAGGKTASAQTGVYSEEGKEIVHAWFSGFYPAQNPRYAIVVLNENGNSGGAVAAPVFRGIANAIHEIERRRGQG
ncbi:MAG: penicillin-binding protein 2 [Provencibacterium sp.]|jgi:penicillin-binding protein 2|nr:penicillin-binding protein 2 [Provencibacterium sp.]